MAVETELKLRIAPGHLAKLKRHPLLKAHTITRPVSRRLYNIYYDTPTLQLHRSEMALRLRRSGRQWLQTLKGGGSVQAGLHQRSEWEIPVSGQALEFSAEQTAEWGEHLPPAWREQLQPVFVTDFTRSSRMLDWQGAQIELCIDQGTVSTGQHSLPICELELELKAGEPQQLFELAQALLEIVPFELEAVSKAEQGFRLLSGHIAGPVKAEAPNIEKTDTLTGVLQTLIWSCVQHLQGNLRGAMGSEPAEYLHQMRVALRRLRVVLGMAKNIRPDAQLAALNRDVAALCAALGQVREWDVFIAQTLQPLRARRAAHSGLQTLLEISEQQRAERYAALRGDAQAREVQRLILRFALWMNGAYWRQPEFAAPAADFAARRLHQLARRMDKAMIVAEQNRDVLDTARLHALRILAKKLRYSAEFFAGWYDGIKPYLGALEAVQEVLGRISDVASAQRLLDGLATHPDATVHDAVAAIRHSLADELSSLNKEMRRSLQAFSRLAADRENSRAQTARGGF